MPLSENSRLLATFIIQVLLQQPFIWDFQYPRALSEKNTHSLRRLRRHALCYRWLSYIWENKTRTWYLTPGSSEMPLSWLPLNSKKYEFCKNNLPFLGYIINQQGIAADPNRTAAIEQMETPKSVMELHSFLGMVNQLRKIFFKHSWVLTTFMRIGKWQKRPGYGPQCKIKYLQSSIRNRPVLAS